MRQANRAEAELCGLPVEVVHGVTGVAGDLVETLPSAHRLLDGVLVALDLIVCRHREERSVHNHPPHQHSQTVQSHGVEVVKNPTVRVYSENVECKIWFVL